MIAFDTTFLIDLLNNNQKAVRTFNEIVKDGELFYTTEINVFELLVGAQVKKREKYTKTAMQMIEHIRILPLIRNASIKAAEICSQLILSGKEIGDTDCLIAGICLGNNCNKIITNNKKHFERIKELEVISY